MTTSAADVTIDMQAMTAQETQTLIQSLFDQDSSLDLSSDLEHYACVAVLLTGHLEDLEIGYIVRAHQPHDRWSGQIAFPGGKREETDSDDYATVTRETTEEIGFSLHRDAYLGRLDDIQARKQGEPLDFFIRPFVFYLHSKPIPALDVAEVSEFFWFPLRELRSPQRQTRYQFRRNNLAIELPAINLERALPLWGLTYFMTQNLLLKLQPQIEMSNSST